MRASQDRNHTTHRTWTSRVDAFDPLSILCNNTNNNKWWKGWVRVSCGPLVCMESVRGGVHRMRATLEGTTTPLPYHPSTV